MEEGADADAVYVIQSGSCAITKNDRTSKDVVINYVPAGALCWARWRC